MDDQISLAVMDDRLQRLQALLNQQQHAFNQASVGLTTSILVERDGKHPGQRIGKSPWLQSVVVETAAAPGTLLDVRIVSAGPNSLGGEPMHNLERRHVA
jgi:tRNA-2-methylthio-N6-dimethylallyladenosine synthase